MALEFLLPNRPQAQFIGFTVIQFDASISESHVYSANVTQNPVENGANVTDNIVVNPVSLTMNGFITDTPVKILLNVLNPREKSGSDSLSKTAHDELVGLFNSKTPFTVITGLKKYENMVLTNLTFPRDSKTGKSVRFNCTLTEIILAKFTVESIETENVSERLETKDQSGKDVQKGSQNTTDANPSQESYRSVAHSILF